MGKRGKRKNRSGSGSGDGDGHLHKKSIRERGPSGESLVSTILNETNSVLYDNNDSIIDSTTDNVFLPPSPEPELQIDQRSKMATNTDSQPTNGDIMACLKGIESRLTGLEKRMSSFDELKNKVDKFDKDLSKLWMALDERNKAMDHRVKVVEDQVESCDYSVNKLSEDVVTLQRQRDEMQEDLVYMQSQSMRNNLIFSNIHEPVNETNEDAEKALRQFMHEKLRVAKDVADGLVLERVHRMGPKNQASSGKRPIVAKFHQFKDREMVRKQWPNLKGTEFYVSEQFPKQVVDKRKKLYPKLKAARDAGKRAWISYDTLYIDGTAVRG